VLKQSCSVEWSLAVLSCSWLAATAEDVVLGDLEPVVTSLISRTCTSFLSLHHHTGTRPLCTSSSCKYSNSNLMLSHIKAQPTAKTSVLECPCSISCGTRRVLKRDSLDSRLARHGRRQTSQQPRKIRITTRAGNAKISLFCLAAATIIL